MSEMKIQKITRKIGLIGVGNMGAAILEGLLSKGLAEPSRVWVFDKITEKARDFSKQWNVRAADSNAELARSTEALILAVKPQDFPNTALEIKDVLASGQGVISILAGTPIEKIAEALGPKPAVVRAMPNLGAKVGQSVTALAGKNPEMLELAKDIFSGCGEALILDEKHFDLVTALSGSGPAYFFLLMEMMAAEGVSGGLSPEEARLLAVQTALGAGLLAQASSETPEALRKRVTSKGGTTEAALGVMEAAKIRGIFHEAIQAARNRGRELASGR